MRIHTLDLDFLDLQEAIAAFAIEGPEGLALVECGPASTLPHLEQAIAAKGWKISDFQHVFLSHIHFDHAGAAWAFAEQGATIYVHPKGLPHLAAPEKLYNSARMIYGDHMDRLWGPMRPIATTQLLAPEHAHVIETLGLRFTAWHTPGHAVHHIAWEVNDGTTSAIFTGDVAGVKIGSGPVMPPCPPPDIDIEAWQGSIDLLRQHPANTLYLTHFGIISDKIAHLDDLEHRLLSWANWMLPHFEAQTPSEEISPLFQAWVKSELESFGLDEIVSERYEAANPAFMSVAGLLRYWKKKRG